MSSNQAARNSEPMATLFVENLHPDVNDTLLGERFSEIGPIKSVRVNRDKETGRSLGSAYVNFKFTNDAEQAIVKMDGIQINGRSISLKLKPSGSSQVNFEKRKIFVGNVDKSIDDEELWTTFAAFGTIADIKIEARQHGVSQGFIVYETEQEATKAIAQAGGMFIGGRKLIVSKFIPGSERKKKDELAKRKTVEKSSHTKRNQEPNLPAQSTTPTSQHEIGNVTMPMSTMSINSPPRGGAREGPGQIRMPRGRGVSSQTGAGVGRGFNTEMPRRGGISSQTGAMRGNSNNLSRGGFANTTSNHRMPGVLYNIRMPAGNAVPEDNSLLDRLNSSYDQYQDTRMNRGGSPPPLREETPRQQSFDSLFKKLPQTPGLLMYTIGSIQITIKSNAHNNYLCKSPGSAFK